MSTKSVNPGSLEDRSPGPDLSRRQLLAGAAAVGWALPAAQLLAACGDSAGSSSSGSITFMKAPHSDQDAQIQKSYAAKFAAANEGASVTPRFYDWETLDADLTAAYGGGSPPDVAYLVSRAWPIYADSGALLDLSDYVEDGDFAATREAIPKELWGGITGEGGEIWGVPWLGAVFPVYLNLDLIDQAGVNDWDSSWDRMFDAATAMRSGDVFGFTMPQTVRDLVYQDLGAYIHNGGGDLVVDGQAGLDQPGVVEAFDLLARIHLDGLAPEPGLYDLDGQDALFRAGRAGIAHANPGLIGDLEAQDPGFEWDVGMVPPGPAAATVYGDFGYLSIAADSEAQDTAWDYVKFLTGRDQTADYVIKLGRQLQAVRPDTAALIFKGVDSPSKRLQSQFVPKAQPYSAMTQQTQALRGLAEEFELLIRGEKTAANAVSAANEKVANLL